MSMSALASSPSPVTSPHASVFHYPQPASRASSLAPPPSPKTNISSRSSPRHRAANARPSPSQSHPTHSRHSRDFAWESTAGKESKPRYADAGTQYSPEGYPPTAGHKLAAIDLQNPDSSAGSRKRKEGDSSRSPNMNATNLAGDAAADPPAEPPLRVDPNQKLPDRPAGQQSEPQEARSTHGHSSAPKRPRAESVAAKIMPRQYETCNPKDLGVLIANMLMELIRLNDQIPLRDGRLTRFHSRAPPGISVADYLQRLIQHATLSPPIMLSMVYYIDRLCALYPAFTVSSLTIHRFLIASATVASKGLSDSFWTNKTYARVGGISMAELALLELEFLFRVEWRIVPQPEVLVDYYQSLVERCDGYEIQRER